MNEFLFNDSLSVMQLILITSSFVIGWVSISKLKQYLVKTVIAWKGTTYLQQGDINSLSSLMASANRFLIMPTPAVISLKGLDEDYQEAFIEFTSFYSCQLKDSSYTGNLDPVIMGVTLNPEQVEVLIQSLEEFLKRKAEGSKEIKVSSDNKVIDIQTMLKNIKEAHQEV